MKHYASCADLIKFSKEDLQILYPNVAISKTAEMLLDAGVKLVVITDGGRTVLAWTHKEHVVRVNHPQLQPSTRLELVTAFRLLYL